MAKYYTTDELKPDMIACEDVRTKSGQTIIPKGTVFTERLIFRMKFYGIPRALASADAVSDTANASAVVKPDAQAPSLSQKVVRSKEFMDFQISYSKTLADYRNVFDTFVSGQGELDHAALLTETKELYSSFRTPLALFDMLHNMRSLEDSVYAHCLNVALLVRRIGGWLRLTPETLDTLTLAGALHDIGKLKIPNEILNKPGKYTDEEFALVRQHPQLGYRLLAPLPLNPHIKAAALSHHERRDGSGYPNGLSGDKIDHFAEIVAIADVYDAMTAARSYRAPLCVFEVIDNFEREGLSKYHPKFILTFLSHIANTYQSNRVMLNDGRTANIVMLNEKHLSKPIVQFMDGSCLDLSTEPSLFIKAVV